MKVLVLLTILFLTFTQVHSQCDPILKRHEQCLTQPVEKQEACIDTANQEYLNCKYKDFKDEPLKLNSLKECKANEVFRVNSCVCKFKQICTKKLCLCYKSIFESCPTSFSRKKMCVCSRGSKRVCKDESCICEKTATSKNQPEKELQVQLNQCSSTNSYTRGSCLCDKQEVCGVKKVNLYFTQVGKTLLKTEDKSTKPCVCINKLPQCSTTKFSSSILCNCKGRKFRKICSKGQCECKKVKMCNSYKTYHSRNECYCPKKFWYTYCQVVNGIKKCKCKHISKKCKQDVLERKGRCYCNLKLNTYECRNVAGFKYCTCKRKPYCTIDQKTKRSSCLCSKIPTTALEDENSELKRVIRKYGWKNCRYIKEKGKKGYSVCTCKALKCYEAGRFKKYFCKCPRKTREYCNKETKYCKCLSKKPRRRFKYNYKFRGLITTDSKKIAAYEYVKTMIDVYLEPNMKKKETRFVFVNHKNGSFYVVQVPTLKPEQMDDELSLYEKEDQNYKSIQKQLHSKTVHFHKKGPQVKK